MWSFISGAAAAGIVVVVSGLCFVSGLLVLVCFLLGLLCLFTLSFVCLCLSQVRLVYGCSFIYLCII